MVHLCNSNLDFTGGVSLVIDGDVKYCRERPCWPTVVLKVVHMEFRSPFGER